MFSPANRSVQYSPAKTTFSPSKFNTTPLKGLAASRSTTLDTSIVSPQSFIVTTPKNHHERSRSISKKLDVQLNVETKKNIAKCEEIESRILQLDEKIATQHAISEDKLYFAETQVIKIQETMAAEVIAQQLLDERIVKEMSLIEGNLAVELQNEKQNNRDSERRVLAKIESHIQSVSNSFFEEQQKTDELKEQQTFAITERIHQLSQGIKEERLNRENAYNTIGNNVSAKLAQMQETMNFNRKRRNENEAEFLEKIENVFRDLQIRVQTENERRERSEEQISNLIEETCDKFEAHLIHSRR